MTVQEIPRLIAAGLRVPFKVKNWPFFYLAYAKKYVPALGRLLSPDSTVILRNGIRLAIRPVTFDRVYIISEIWLLNDYDRSGHDIQPGQTVIDLGAHIGIFSTYAASRGAKVLAFEPFPESYALLMENIRINTLEKSVSAYNEAVSVTEGELLLHSDSKNPGANSLILKGDHVTNVKTTTLANIFRDNNLTHCDLLKVDIEGAEYEVLYNTSAELYKKIDRIYLEWHVLDAKENHNPEALQLFLEQHGYVVKPGFRMLYASKIGDI